MTLTVFLVAGAGLAAKKDKPEKPGPEYKPGLVASYYSDPEKWDGNWPDDVSIPSVSALDWTFSSYAYSRVEPLINHRFVHKGWFSVRWVGFLDTSAVRRETDENSAEYTFSVLADDGCRLIVDGVVLIDDWVPCWEKSPQALRIGQPIKLDDGMHSIVVEYFQGQNLRHADHDPIKLMWSCDGRGIKKAKIISAAYLCHTKENLTQLNP